MKLPKYFLLCFLVLFACCNSNESRKVFESEKCDAIDTIMFNKKQQSISKSRKPNSVTDAVKLLDSLADDNFRCAVLKIKEEDLYFNLGLNIRNEWIRHGTDSIRNQLFYKLRVTSVDYTSGLIIDIYKQYLTNKDVDLAKKYLKDNTDSSYAMREKEFKAIQKELFLKN